MNRRTRVIATIATVGLVLEGFFLIIFSRQTTIPSALCLLVLSTLQVM